MWTFPKCNKNNLRISNGFNSRISNSFNSRKPKVLDQKRSQRPFDRRFQSDKTIVVAISLCPGILLRYMTSTSFQSHILSACAHQTAKCLLLHIRRGTSSHYRRVIWVLASVIDSVFVNSANISTNIETAMLSITFKNDLRDAWDSVVGVPVGPLSPQETRRIRSKVLGAKA